MDYNPYELMISRVARRRSSPPVLIYYAGHLVIKEGFDSRAAKHIIFLVDELMLQNIPHYGVMYGAPMHHHQEIRVNHSDLIRSAWWRRSFFPYFYCNPVPPPEENLVLIPYGPKPLEEMESWEPVVIPQPVVNSQPVVTPQPVVIPKPIGDQDHHSAAVDDVCAKCHQSLDITARLEAIEDVLAMIAIMSTKTKLSVAEIRRVEAEKVLRKSEESVTTSGKEIPKPENIPIAEGAVKNPQEIPEVLPKSEEVLEKTEEVEDKGPLVENEVTNGLGVSEFEDAPASELTSVLDEVAVTLDRIKIVSSPVPGTSSTLAAKPFDTGVQVGKVGTVEVNSKMKITKPNKTDEEPKIMSSETIPGLNCSKMLKRLMEKKIAEFDHLPNVEKYFAVRAAVEAELEKNKDKKIKKCN